MVHKNVFIGLAIVVVAVVIWMGWFRKGGHEHFTHSQIALNAKDYTFIPPRRDCPMASRPNFAAMTCGCSELPSPLAGMTKEQIEKEIDLHYRKHMEMVDPADLLPETDVSGLSFGTDPADDFANKFVWHRTTHARLKRRNWEGGDSMIRGDLIIDPGKQSWFQHTHSYQDLTPGFIPQEYCGQISVTDLTYGMPKAI